MLTPARTKELQLVNVRTSPASAMKEGIRILYLRDRVFVNHNRKPSVDNKQSSDNSGRFGIIRQNYQHDLKRGLSGNSIKKYTWQQLPGVCNFLNIHPVIFFIK
jgi:hypothetical protein